MNKFGTLTPYAASYVIVRKDGKIACVLRSNTNWMNGYYGLPSGKVEVGENFTAAAIREAKEEVGIDVEAKDLRYIHTVQRHEDTDWVDIYFEAEKWQGEPHNAEPHMHSELAWLDPNDMPKNTIPAVVDALAHIEAGRPYSEYGWR